MKFRRTSVVTGSDGAPIVLTLPGFIYENGTVVLHVDARKFRDLWQENEAEQPSLKPDRDDVASTRLLDAAFRDSPKHPVEMPLVSLERPSASDEPGKLRITVFDKDTVRGLIDRDVKQFPIALLSFGDELALQKRVGTGSPMQKADDWIVRPHEGGSYLPVADVTQSYSTTTVARLVDAHVQSFESHQDEMIRLEKAAEKLRPVDWDMVASEAKAVAESRQNPNFVEGIRWNNQDSAEYRIALDHIKSEQSRGAYADGFPICQDAVDVLVVAGVRDVTLSEPAQFETTARELQPQVRGAMAQFADPAGSPEDLIDRFRTASDRLAARKQSSNLDQLAIERLEGGLSRIAHGVAGSPDASLMAREVLSRDLQAELAMFTDRPRSRITIAQGPAVSKAPAAIVSPAPAVTATIMQDRPGSPGSRLGRILKVARHTVTEKVFTVQSRLGLKRPGKEPGNNQPE